MPNGKLRLLYECNPASFIMEQAGGSIYFQKKLFVEKKIEIPIMISGFGTNGSQNILDIQPKTIHDRSQVFIGAKEEIEEMRKYLNNEII